MKKKVSSKSEAKETPSKKSSPKSKKDFLVVGIGASAGGVKALQEFFSLMPPNSGMAFVVILHLSPVHESNLAEIIQAQTPIPVTVVNETHRVEPNRVYVVPPNRQLEMVDGVVRGKELDGKPCERAVIDVFFRTLAAEYAKNAVCIVLSGTGSDGTLGLKAIKEANGFAVVQDPKDAEHDAMPRSAIRTRLVDWVLPIREMPEKLLQFRDSSERMHLTKDGEDGKVAEEIQADVSLREILTVLRVRTGHDFSNYKTPTLVRRIARHLQIHDLPDIPSYLEYLRERPEEIQSLLKNLLINVTNFFRDKDAWLALEAEVLPNLFAGKKGSDQVRVWSCGCASGEEAYSLAMILSEYAFGLNDPPKIQVFATDVDEDAIVEARENRYPLSIETDVSAERLKRFFTKEGKYYRIKKELREMVLFAPHNVLRDPPFSKLNLIVCRNLLIYLNRDTQERVMEIFHFALLQNGHLFLGSSESAEMSPQLFSPIDKKFRIYSRRSINVGQTRVPPRMPVVGRWEFRVPDAQAKARGSVASLSEIHYKLLEKISPPSLLVNQDFDVVFMSEAVGRYLRFKGGEPTANLLKMAHPDLLPDLRGALFSAQREKKNVEFENVHARLDDKETVVNIIVRTVEIENETSDYLLVIFDEDKKIILSAEDEKEVPRAPKDDAMQAIVVRLEEDLARTKQTLRTTIEQHEISSEELKASNEELQAINEELRSTTEELETSKEELQSVNEELTTVNHELKEKMDETTRANSDLNNLMAATDIATIFLDRELRIKRSTPPVEKIFNISPLDAGRPLEHFTNKLDYKNLNEDVERVLRSLSTVEREIRDHEDRTYLARLLPYRTLDDRIEGVVLNFIDITERKRAEEALQSSEEKYRTLFETIDEGFCIIEVLFDKKGKPFDYRFLEANPAFIGQTGLENSIGKTMLELAPQHEKFWFEIYGEVARTGVPKRFEHRAEALTPPRWYDVYAFRVGAAGENKVAIIFNDIAERKQSDQELRRTNQLLQTMFDSSVEDIQLFKAVRDERGDIVDFEWRLTNKHWNDQWGEMSGKRLLAENPAVVETGLFEKFKQVTESGVPMTHEQYYAHEQFNGWFWQTIAKAEDGFLLTTLDITERKRREANLAFLAEVSQDLVHLTSVDETMTALGRKIGEYFKVSRVNFAVINEAADEAVITHEWYASGLKPTAGGRVYRRNTFISEEFYRSARAGEMLVVRDTRSDSRTTDAAYAELDTRSFVTAPFVRDGEWQFLISVADTAPRDWQTDEIELLREVTTRIWTRLERARAEEALKESEEKFRTLFDSIDEGFCLIELIYDENEKAVDYRFLEVNRVFERQTGLENAAGKLGSEILPNTELHWLEPYQRVVQTGEPQRVENYNQDTERWYASYASRVGGAGSRLVALVFDDITERKQRERQQEFILKFSDALRAETNADDAANRALLMLSEELSLDRCYIGVYRLEDDRADLTHQVGNERVPPLPDTIRLSDFPEAFQVVFDQTLVIEDFAAAEGLSDTDRQNIAALGLRALVAPCLRRGENSPLWSIVAVSSRPRRWTQGEIALIEEVTERTWAAMERARAEEALRRSEEKYRTLFDSIDEGYLLCEVIFDENDKPIDILYLDANPAAVRLAGRDFTGRRMREIDPDYEDYWYEIIGRVALTGEAVRAEHYAKSHNRWFDFYAFRIGGEESRRVASVFQDTTERRSAEESLRESEEQFRRAIEDAPIPVIMHAEDGEVLQVSRSWTELTGYTLEDKDVIQTWLTRAYGFGGEKVRDAMELSFAPQAGKPMRAVVFDIITKQGERRTWSFSASTPGTLRDGRRFVVGMAEDITERIRAEETLRESERRFRSVFYGNMMAMGIWTKSGGIVDANDALLELVGYTRAELDAEQIKWNEITPPEYLPLDEQALREIAESGICQPFEKEYIRKDGTRIPVLIGGGNFDETGEMGIFFAVDLTERRKAEEALRESEERFRAMFEQANVGIVQIDLDGHLIMPNPGFCEIIGCGEEEVRRLTVRDITHGDDYPREEKLTEQLIKGKIPGFSIEKRYIRRDGTIVWGQMTTTIVRHQSEEPLYALAIVEDITERKRIEQALRENEQRLRLATEAGNLATWEWNLATNEVFWNPRHFELFGLAPHENPINPDLFFDHVHENDREQVREKLAESIKNKTVFQSQFRARLETGEVRWMEGYGQTVETGANGETVKMSGVMSEITERKRAEQLLRKSENRLKLILESAKDYAIIAFDLDGRITRWNSGAELIFGYSEKEAVGQTTHLLFTPEDRAAGVPEMEMKKALREGRADDERWHLRKDGARFFASGVMQLLRDGETEGFVKICRDQTERLRAENALREREMLAQLVSMQEDERRRIARDIHDHIGQQLTVLRLKLESLKKMCDEQTICDEIDGLSVVTDQLDREVDFLAWELRPAALDELGLRVALSNFVTEWAAFTGIKCEFHAHGLDRQRLVFEVETNLYRIAQEALNNIYKHAKAKNVSVLLEKRKDAVSLIIEDDGIGFNPRDKKKRNQGLGLMGMIERAKLSGGTLEIESAKGKGTTIYARVPLEK
jgi:PAS domain S-box-containing protein